MYSLGENWGKIYEICFYGLKKKPNDELLTNVMEILADYDKKYGIKYKISFGEIKVK